MALIAGMNAVSGRVMGHAGAFVGRGENNAMGKVRALQKAGVVITNHPSKFGEGMKSLLNDDRINNFKVLCYLDTSALW